MIRLVLRLLGGPAPSPVRAAGSFERGLAGIVVITLLILTVPVGLAESYVQFTFQVSNDAGANPFAREISAEVKLPKGDTLRVPAFYAAPGTYAVRVYAGERGMYRFVRGFDEQKRDTDLKAQLLSPQQIEVLQPNARSFVRLDPADPRRFAATDGRVYFPIGANLPWPDAAGTAFYAKYLREFQQRGLNWTRIWMAHWANLNLDWAPTKAPPIPVGTLSSEVAAKWDQILSGAEEAGVYVQVVLQHHGQFATLVDPNWTANPWNVANPGGFLKAPSEFFTSDEARRLTKSKYRYIVARWGYSPAVLCWELFNEVQNTDAIRLEHSDAIVAAWHSDLAAYLRSVDAYHHLVATSFQDLASSVYSAMDYRQPHLYAVASLAEVRRMRQLPQPASAPSFFGEIGDDNMLLPKPLYRSGVALIPSVWASLVGEGTQPAQCWYGERLFATGRIEELTALARVVRESKLAEQRDLQASTVPVESTVRIPLVVAGGQWWEKRADPVIAIPNDGREPAEYGDVPRVLVGKPESVAEGFPSRVAFDVDQRKAASLRIRIADAAPRGATLRVLVDGEPAAINVWPGVLPADAPPSASADVPPRPAEIALDVPAGRHRIELINTGSADYVTLQSIDFGTDVPTIAAAAKRGPDYAFVWAWNRTGVYSLEKVPAARATLKLENLTAGAWKAEWWDGVTGTKLSSTVVAHNGGTLAVETPEIERHAALVLQRQR